MIFVKMNYRIISSLNEVKLDTRLILFHFKRGEGMVDMVSFE